MKRKSLIFCFRAFLFFSITATFALFYYFSNLPVSQASTSDNVFGFAWASNIGWIKFNNCDDPTNPATCSGSDFGVTINPATGELSGYAWSNSVGWLSFDPATAGFDAAHPQTRLDFATNQISGWARFLSNGGGWDGWLSLRNGSYGISRNGCDLEGFAWGDLVVGWIKFNDPSFGGNNVKTTECAVPFNYSLSNSGGITVVRGNSGSNTITATLISGTTQPVDLDDVSGLPAGASYSWPSGSNCSPDCQRELRIDSGTAAVNPLGYDITVTGNPLSKTTSFDLIVQPPPALSCSINVPSSASINEKVTWGVIPSGGSSPYTVNSWSGIGVDVPPSPFVDKCKQGPPEKVKDCQYSKEGSYVATATITDVNNNTVTCSATVKISSLPIWEEISPVSWILLSKLVFNDLNQLNKLLAGIVNIW